MSGDLAEVAFRLADEFAMSVSGGLGMRGEWRDRIAAVIADREKRLTDRISVLEAEVAKLRAPVVVGSAAALTEAMAAVCDRTSPLKDGRTWLALVCGKTSSGWARQRRRVFAYALRSAGYSWGEVGEALGGRDRKTIRMMVQIVKPHEVREAESLLKAAAS